MLRFQAPVFCSMLFLLSVAPRVAAAQGTSTNTRDALVLITQEIVEGPAQRTTSFWWARAGAPAQTPFDTLVGRHMGALGVKARWPAANAPFAQSYRRAHMPPSNAASLSGVLGVKRAIVGSVVIDVIAPKGQLGQVGARAVARVMLVSAGQTAFTVANVVTVSHTSYATSKAKAIEQAQAVVGKDVAGQMARRIKRNRTKVGVGLAERPIVLQNVGDRAHLEAIKQRLLGVDRISAVEIVWAAHGHIALVINPKVQDKEDLLEQAERTLLSGAFALGQTTPGFVLQRAIPKGPLRVVRQLQESLGQPATP